MTKYLGKLPRMKICFPQYFGINRRLYKKKKNLTKKADFQAVLLFKANVRLWPPRPPLVPGVFNRGSLKN